MSALISQRLIGGVEPSLARGVVRVQRRLYAVYERASSAKAESGEYERCVISLMAERACECASDGVMHELLYAC